MHSLLKSLLTKRGIKDLSELSTEEKETFENWDIALTGTITVEKIKQFCEGQISRIQDQYANPDNTEKKDMYLKASLTIYSTLIKIINSPEAERESLEKYLTKLLQ